MSSNLKAINLVELPHGLKKSETIETIKQDIVNAIQSIKSLVLSPSNLELIHYLATLIEAIVDKKHNIDKMTLLKEILLQLFPSTTNDELVFAESTIEYMLSQKLIKKIPILKKALSYSWEILKKVIKIKG
jgi:hypothetical protein